MVLAEPAHTVTAAVTQLLCSEAVGLVKSHRLARRLLAEGRRRTHESDMEAATTITDVLVPIWEKVAEQEACRPATDARDFAYTRWEMALRGSDR